MSPRRGHRMPVIATGVTTVAAGLALVGSSAGATYEPGDPTLAFGHTFDGGATSDEVRGVDYHDGRVYTVGTTDGAVAGPSAGGYDYFYSVGRGAGDPGFVDQDGTTQTERAAGIDAGPWGAVVVGDTTGNFASPNYGSFDVFVRRYRPDGTIAWTTQVGTAGSDYPADVLVSGGVVYVVGGAYLDSAHVSGFVRAFDLGDGHQTDQQVFDTPERDDVNAIARLAGGDLVIGGATAGALPGGGGSHGGRDAFLMRLDPATLDPVWTRQVGTADGEDVRSLAVRGSTIFWGGSLEYDVAGSYTTDGLVGAFTDTGAARWKRRAGTQRGYGTAVIARRDGVVLAGQVVGDVATEPGEGVDAFLQGWSAAGARRWTSRFGGPGLEFASDLAYGPQGLVLGGSTQSNLFGTPPVGGDGFVAVLWGHDPRARLKVGRAGFAQRKRLELRRGHRGVATLRIRNEGDAVERLKVAGCRPPRGVTMVVKQGSRAVTGTVRSGRYYTPGLAPGRSISLKLRFQAKRTAALRTSTCRLTVSSTYQRQARQNATLVVRVRR